jgi:galactose-1-phosphate uridylyltransferase
MKIFFALFTVLLSVFITFKLTRRDQNMTCVFCDIVNKKTNTVILFEDEELIAFKDIKPAASHHYLIIPKKHIPNVKSLTTNDKPMRKCYLIA